MDDVRPEVLISRLTSDNETWRVDAERRLIALGPAAVEPLIHSLQHASPAVRLHAVHALGHLKDPRGIGPVVAALSESENHGAVAIAAEKALIAWGPAVAPALSEVATKGEDGVRPRAIRALGRVGGADAEMLLRSLLTDANPAVRTQAAVALAVVLDKRAIDVISPLLQDPDKWVRYGVAEALVGVDCVRGEAALREAAEDDEERGTHIQFWAEDLLETIDDLKRSKRAVV